jgi:hypothetical protein
MSSATGLNTVHLRVIKSAAEGGVAKLVARTRAAVAKHGLEVADKLGIFLIVVVTIFWVIFNIWLCIVVTGRVQEAGLRRDFAFLLGMTVGFADYCLLPCFVICLVVHCCDQPGTAKAAVEDAMGGEVAGAPPAYLDCVGPDAPPDYTTAMANMV